MLEYGLFLTGLLMTTVLLSAFIVENIIDMILWSFLFAARNCLINYCRFSAWLFLEPAIRYPDACMLLLYIGWALCQHYSAWRRIRKRNWVCRAACSSQQDVLWDFTSVFCSHYNNVCSFMHWLKLFLILAWIIKMQFYHIVVEILE